MKTYIVLRSKDTVIIKKKRVGRKKQYFIAGIINAINAANETNFKIFKDFQARGDAKTAYYSPYYEIDKRGQISFTYVMAIIVIIILIIVGAWVGFKKLKQAK